MPFYQQIIVTIPKFDKSKLVALFRRHTEMVLNDGGNVRAIEHNGIRPLPERAKKRYATRDGERYFWDARYTSSFFDANPRTLTEIGRMLRNEEGVLRFFTLKKPTTAERTASENYKNPYLKRSETK
jgi:ribosomal protein S6